MASKNIIEVVKKHQLTLDIITTKADYINLKKGLEEFQLNLGKINYTFIEEIGHLKKNIPGEVGNQKYSFLTELQNEALKNSDDYDYIIFNYSDFIWSNGSLINLVEMLTGNEDAVLGFCLPVDKQNFINEVRLNENEYFTAGVLELENKKSIQLALNSLHRETKLRFWESPNFTIFPSYLIWSVPEEGLILRAYHQTILALKTKLKYLKDGISGQGSLDGYVSSLVAERGRYKIADDSNKVFIYSLYETGLDSLAPPWITREESLARSLVQYIKVPQRELAKVAIKIQKEKIDEKKWKEVEKRSLEEINNIHDAVEFNGTLYAYKNKPEISLIIKKTKYKKAYDYLRYKLSTYGKLLTNSKILKILFFKIIDFPIIQRNIQKIDLYISNMNSYRIRRFIEKRIGLYQIRMRLLNKITEYYKKLRKKSQQKNYGNIINFKLEAFENSNVSNAWQKFGLKDWYGHIDRLGDEITSSSISCDEKQIHLSISRGDKNIHLGYRLTAEQCIELMELDKFEIAGNIWTLKKQNIKISAHILVPTSINNYSEYDDFTGIFKARSLDYSQSKVPEFIWQISDGQVWVKFRFDAVAIRHYIDLSKGIQISLNLELMEDVDNELFLKNISFEPSKSYDKNGIYGVDIRVNEAAEVIESIRTRSKYLQNFLIIEAIFRRIVLFIDLFLNIKLITNYSEEKENNFSIFIIKRINRIIYEVKTFNVSENEKKEILRYCTGLANWMLKLDPDNLELYIILVKINLIEKNYNIVINLNEKFINLKNQRLKYHSDNEKIKYCTYYVEKGYERDFILNIINIIKNKILSQDERKYLVVFESHCGEYDVIKHLFSDYIYLYLSYEITPSDWLIINDSKIIWQIQAAGELSKKDCNLKYYTNEVEAAWIENKPNQSIINCKFEKYIAVERSNEDLILAIDYSVDENKYFIERVIKEFGGNFIYVPTEKSVDADLNSDKLFTVLSYKLNPIQVIQNIIRCKIFISDDNFLLQIAKEFNKNILYFKYSYNKLDSYIESIRNMHLNSNNINQFENSNANRNLNDKLNIKNRILDIIVPTLDRPSEVHNLIVNFLEINEPNFYLYIIDDGSNDREYIEGYGYLSTFEVCNIYISNSNILYRRRPTNMGVAEAWNLYFSSEINAKYAMFLRDKDRIISFDPIIMGIKKLENSGNLSLVILPIDKRDRIQAANSSKFNFAKMDDIGFLEAYIENEILQHCSMGGGGIYRVIDAKNRNLPNIMGLCKYGLDDAFGIDFDFLMRLVKDNKIDFIAEPGIRWVKGGGATEKFPLTFAYCYYQYVKRIFSTTYNQQRFKKIKKKYIKFWILLMIRGHYVSLNPVHGTESEYGTSRIKYHLNGSFYNYILFEMIKNQIIPNFEMIRLLIGAFLFEKNSDLLPKYNSLVNRIIYRN